MSRSLFRFDIILMYERGRVGIFFRGVCFLLCYSESWCYIFFYSDFVYYYRSNFVGVYGSYGGVLDCFGVDVDLYCGILGGGRRRNYFGSFFFWWVFNVFG